MPSIDNSHSTLKKFAFGMAIVISFVLFNSSSVSHMPASAPAVVLASNDPTAPSIPQNVTATPMTSSTIKVSWSASTDKVGVAGYNVFQESRFVVSVHSGTSYTITGLVAPTSHTYYVNAYDASGNVSALSAGASASILLPATATTTATTTTSISTTTVTSTISYDAQVIAGNAVAFWDLNPQTDTEPDLSGKGNTGTYQNGIPAKTTMPNGDTAAVFNGTNQYLSVPSNVSFSIPTTGVLTWEAWIRPDTLSFPTASADGYVDFLGKCAEYGPTCEWEGRMYGSTTPQARTDRISAYAFNPSAGLGSGADWQPSSDQIINAGQWIHVVAEYTLKAQPLNCPNASFYPGSIDIWVNGVKWSQQDHAPTGCMSQYSVIPQANNSPLLIGTMSTDYLFKGAIGKVAIYRYALNQNQITDHYKRMTGKLPTGSCAETCSF